MGSRGERRRWVVEDIVGGGGEKLGGGECLGGGMGSRGGDVRRRWRRWVVEEEIGGDRRR